MSRSPFFTVHNPAGEYVAACKHAEDAGAVVALYGPGARIRARHGVVLWEEGRDGSAGESYDRVAEVCAERLEACRA